MTTGLREAKVTSFTLTERVSGVVWPKGTGIEPGSGETNSYGTREPGTDKICQESLLERGREGRGS